MPNERPGPDASNRVVWLSKRRPSGKQRLSASSGGPALNDLARYQQSGDEDYRHRMITNVLAFVFCLFLVIAGVWLANKIAEMRKNQDCVLSGRRNCTPVDAPVQNRW
jgi:hypothetical protein